MCSNIVCNFGYNLINFFLLQGYISFGNIIYIKCVKFFYYFTFFNKFNKFYSLNEENQLF